MPPAAPKKLIVITGATRGLGRALVNRFIPLGHRVCGCGTSAQGIHQLRTQFGAPHEFIALDVCDADEVAAWANNVVQQAGTPDLLINNAGVINKPASLWKVSRQDFDKVIDVNVKGVANVLRSFLPAMLARKSGVIVNLSSGWGRSVSADVAPYCASKYAIEGLTLALAQELPTGMGAIPLNPGIIDTDMLRACFGSAASSYTSAGSWADKAAPFLLGLTAKDNGKSMTVPGMS